MRIYSRYTFKTGKRYNLSELFAIIDAFLSEQGLKYDTLAYDFRTGDHTAVYGAITPDSQAYDWAQKHLRRISDCHALCEKYPDFHSPERISLGNTFDFRLSNLDDTGKLRSESPGEDLIRLAATKIPRPYNFRFSFFMYYNVNFFSKNVPHIEEKIQYDWERLETKCPYIAISREFNGPQSTCVHMMVDVTHGEQVLDAEPYARALAEALGGIRYSRSSCTAMAAAERAQYEFRMQQAEPDVQTVREALKNSSKLYSVPQFTRQRNMQTTNFTLSKSVKKIGKKFGFDHYRYDPIGVHFLSKRTAQGHWLTLAVDVPPLLNEIRLSAHFGGVGFDYVFPMPEFYVPDQKTADTILQTAFGNLLTLEKGELDRLGQNFPDSAAWYQKNGI